jgi:hypothetical protein
LVSSETRPSSSGVWKKLGRAAALPKWSVMAELEGAGLAGADAVAADCVPVLMICFILRVPDLAGTAVFSAVGVLGAGCSNAASAACPAEAGAGSVRTSGTSGAFPFSMPVLLSPAPASSAVPVPLAGAPVLGASGWGPVSMWTSEAEGSC